MAASSSDVQESFDTLLENWLTSLKKEGGIHNAMQNAVKIINYGPLSEEEQARLLDEFNKASLPIYAVTALEHSLYVLNYMATANRNEHKNTPSTTQQCVRKLQAFYTSLPGLESWEISIDLDPKLNAETTAVYQEALTAIPMLLDTPNEPVRELYSKLITHMPDIASIAQIMKDPSIRNLYEYIPHHVLGTFDYQPILRNMELLVVEFDNAPSDEAHQTIQARMLLNLNALLAPNDDTRAHILATRDKLAPTEPASSHPDHPLTVGILPKFLQQVPVMNLLTEGMHTPPFSHTYVRKAAEMGMLGTAHFSAIADFMQQIKRGETISERGKTLCSNLTGAAYDPSRIKQHVREYCFGNNAWKTSDNDKKAAKILEARLCFLSALSKLHKPKWMGESRPNASDDEKTLFRELMTHYQTFCSSEPTEVNFNSFTANCNASIARHRPAIEQVDPKAGKILKNIVAAILGIGIGYAIAGAVNYANTGNFFFFRTKKEEQMDTLKEALDSANPHSGEPRNN